MTQYTFPRGGKRQESLDWLTQEFINIYRQHGCVEMRNIYGGIAITIELPPQRNYENLVVDTQKSRG